MGKRKVGGSLRCKSYETFSLKTMFFSEEDVFFFFLFLKTYLLSIFCHCKVMQSTDVGLASVNKAVRKMKQHSVQCARYQGMSFQGSNTFPVNWWMVKTFYSLSFFLWGDRKELDRGWTGKKEEKLQRCFSIEQLRSLYYMLCLIGLYGYIIEIHKS